MGAYKYYNPSTQKWEIVKSKSIIKPDGSLEYTPDDIKTLEDDLVSHKAESATIKHKAKEIGLEDIATNFTAVNVEGAMGELFTNVSNGKDLVSGAITGIDDNVVIPANPTFNDLASAIGGVSTGRRWASGSAISHATNLEFKAIPNNTTHRFYYIDVVGLAFKPSFIYVTTVDIPYQFTIYKEEALPGYDIVLPAMQAFEKPNPISINGNTSPAYVEEGSFLIPVGSWGSHNYNWLAFE